MRRRWLLVPVFALGGLLWCAVPGDTQPPPIAENVVAEDTASSRGLPDTAPPPEDTGRPTAESILDSVSNNMNLSGVALWLDMLVIKGKRQKVYSLTLYLRRPGEAALTFSAPARDAGTLMVMSDGEMWTYFPSVGKSQKISGHMLRENLMGSDLSYEEMAARTLSEEYTASILGETILDVRPCWKLELTARSEDVAYPRRVLWVDQVHHLPVREDRYARSGVLVKTVFWDDFAQWGTLWLPTLVGIQDRMSPDNGTFITLKGVVPLTTEDDWVFDWGAEPP